jgi:hypothetical protein
MSEAIRSGVPGVPRLYAPFGKSAPAAAETANGGGSRSTELEVSRTPAGGDTDTATSRTVAKMCEYIRAGRTDDMMQRAASYAWRRFGHGLPDTLAARCWAVFWYVKHCIQFRQDEATMFRLGLDGEHDLVVAPSVLVRMKDPAEDCDGFTCFGASLLSILGVKVYVCTAALNPEEPRRWSHVFPVAELPGGPLPLDMSHGPGPGWMVPAERISRFQAWDLDGKPVNMPIPRAHSLHGYRRTGRGMGACDPSVFDLSTCGQDNAPAAPSWTDVVGTLANDATSILRPILVPPAYQQVTRDQYGNVSSTTIRSPVGAAGAGVNFGGVGALPAWVPWAVGGAVLFAIVKGSRR